MMKYSDVQAFRNKRINKNMSVLMFQGRLSSENALENVLELIFLQLKLDPEKLECPTSQHVTKKLSK